MGRIRYVLCFIALLLLLLGQGACKRSAPGPESKESSPSPQSAQSTAPSQSALICIDPGHPSEISSGATVQNGTSEVYIAWVVALRMKKMLEEEGYNVILTKNEQNQLVRNKERAMIANRARAVLMVRLHCDASTDQGYALYFPDRAGAVEGMTGPAPEVQNQSRILAEALHQEMARELNSKLKDGGVRSDTQTFIGSKQGALTGSIFSQVPVVTIEMVVLRNRQDAEYIKSEAGQQKMARAIANGVVRYLKEQAQLVSNKAAR